MSDHEQMPGDPNGAQEVALAQRPPDAGLDFDEDLGEDLLDVDETGDWIAPDDEDDDYDDEERFQNLIEFAGQAGATLAAPPAELDERVRRLEAAAAELAAAEVTRESRRVRRKVTAATTGAGAAGFIPILLQLVDVLSLDPTIAATVAACASLIGAFGAGWMTPERRPPLPHSTAQDLLKLADQSR